MKSFASTKERWKQWRSSRDPDRLVLGPWDHWRRSFVLLGLAFLLFAFAPWVFEAPPLRPSSTPEKIWKSGRVGEPVLWGSSLSFHPGFPKAPSAPEEIFNFQGRSPLLFPLVEKTTYPRPPLPEGELGRFEEIVFTKREVVQLAAAEKRLAKNQDSDRGLLYLVLQRMIEGAWLQEEARLQGIEINDPQIEGLLRQHPRQVGRLRRAGLSDNQIRERARTLLLASLVRSRIPKGRSLSAFEAEWIQRWKPRTECAIDLPLCGEKIG